MALAAPAMHVGVVIASSSRIGLSIRYQKLLLATVERMLRFLLSFALLCLATAPTLEIVDRLTYPSLSCCAASISSIDFQRLRSLRFGARSESS